MTVSESRRHDLYNGLTQILGPDLTDTLMAYLPQTPGAALATREDVFVLRDELSAVRDELREEISEVRAEVRHLSQRFDRFQLTLVAGFMSMVVALIVVGFFG